jgi:hypothetical protein
MVLPTLAEAETVEVVRRGHDFARRWMAGEDIRAGEAAYVTGVNGPDVLRGLLVSLRVPIPNRRVMPGWGGQHLYPYIGELIHYDAVPRRNREVPVSIEQYTYRGGGGLAHKILRTDPDASRLAANQAGLLRLVEDSGGPLGRLVNACSAHDLQAATEGADQREADTEVYGTRWVNLLREGVRNITGRSDLARPKQVELLMHFIPFCIARHQLDRACTVIGVNEFEFPTAMVTRTSPARRMSRQELDRARGILDRALQKVIDVHTADLTDAEQAERVLQAASARAWRTGIIAFFTGTMATAGALNAHVGSRYVTIQLPLLEALVCALMPSQEEVEFDRFCTDILADRLGLVVDKRSASKRGLTERVDAGEFLENELQLAEDLQGIGMMSEYSDATRMVHGEVG